MAASLNNSVAACVMASACQISRHAMPFCSPPTCMSVCPLSSLCTGWWCRASAADCTASTGSMASRQHHRTAASCAASCHVFCLSFSPSPRSSATALCSVPTMCGTASSPAGVRLHVMVKVDQPRPARSSSPSPADSSCTRPWAFRRWAGLPGDSWPSRWAAQLQGLQLVAAAGVHCCTAVSSRDVGC